MANAASAFQVTYHACAVGNMSYAHEFGHLQGARHDWLVDSTNNSPFAYNHGYTPGTGWRTVMSYSNSCTSSCPRVQQWSNPNVHFAGAPVGPTGVNGTQPTNNALTLNNTALTVANFVHREKAEITLPAPDSTLGSPSQQFSWSSNGATRTHLFVGSEVGRAQYFNSGNLGTATSVSATDLPQDGSTVHVRLWTKTTSWHHNDYTYTAAAPTMPTVISPEAGSNLTASEPFVWGPSGLNVTDWWLQIGSTPGSSNIYNSGKLSALTQNRFITPIGSSTGEVHLKLWYKINGGNWQNIQKMYYTDIVDSGFFEPFNSLVAWTEENGNWFSQGGRARVTDSRSNAGEWVSLTRTASNYTDVDYSARIYRTGDMEHPNAMVVRFSGGIDSIGYCQDCLIFQWTTNGQYSIYKRVGGIESAVQGWTSSPVITTGWNLGRVVMIGSRYWFIINGELVAEGSDASLSAGSVGVAGYKNSILNIWVDYTELDVPTADTLNVLDGLQVSDEQKIINVQADSSAGNSESTH